MNARLTILTLFFTLTNSFQLLVSQELNCTVSVNSDQVEGSEKRVFEVMEKAIFEFMNSRKWTEDKFKPEERIECNFTFNVTERVSSTKFKGTLNVQSRRPIYGTSYYSTLLNRVDKDMEWEFVEFDPLDFSENTYISNLTSVLAYYAYYIIGLDYDSFSLHGGTAYFKKAQQIANNAQSASEPGWKSFGDFSNRYWVVENTLNNVFEPIRKLYYEYHRIGFDNMQKDLVKSREHIANSLNLLTDVYNQKPGSYQLQLFFYSKSDEIVNLFKEATPTEKNNVVNLLNRIDPGNTKKYAKILEK